MNKIKTLFFIIISPKTAFLRIANKGDLIIPIILILLASFIYPFKITSFVDHSKYPSFMVTIFNIYFYFLSTILLSASIFVKSIFFKLLLKGFSIQVNLKKLFSAFGHIIVVDLVFDIVTLFIVLILGGNSNKINILQNEFSLIKFFPDLYSSDKILYFVLGSINIVSIWNILLTFIAIKILTNISNKKNVLLVLSWWIISTSILSFILG